MDPTLVDGSRGARGAAVGRVCPRSADDDPAGREESGEDGGTGFQQQQKKNKIQLLPWRKYQFMFANLFCIASGTDGITQCFQAALLDVRKQDSPARVVVIMLQHRIAKKTRLRSSEHQRMFQVYVVGINH